MTRPRWRSLTTPFSQISVAAHSPAKQAPMMKREANQIARWSMTSIAAKHRSGRPNKPAERRGSPSTAIIRGRNGPTNRMPAPASDAFSPIAQLDRPYFSSASEK